MAEHTSQYIATNALPPVESLLRSHTEIRGLYFLPNDPLADSVLIPGFQSADRVDCMAGFFSSQALVSLAPGLATYIASSKNSLRLIISPLLTPILLAKVSDVLPEIAESTEREIEMAVEKVLTGVASELIGKTQKALSEKGYLDS